jgi:HAD superfamily hydrolase (TIGR01509 family)
VSGAHWGLVVFDNDGVVVDSEALAERAMSETLTALGYPMTPEECGAAFRGSTLGRTRGLVEQWRGSPLPASFEEMMRANIFSLISKYLQPVAGIELVLDCLDASGTPYCIASSGRRDRIQFALETAGLLERFGNRWWGAEDVTEGKPAPDLFLLAAREMGFPPSSCVVIEDAEVGVQAARAAGMAVLGFAARTPAEMLAGADRIFYDMKELPGLLFNEGPNGPGSA